MRPNKPNTAKTANGHENRKKVIKAAALRHDALRYDGGSAQRQAATQQGRAQVRGDWRCDGALREHAREASSQGRGREARYGA